MTKKKITFWACDYSENSGEGNLARKFIKENYKKEKKNIQVIRSKDLLSCRYITPFIGIISCWKYYLKDHRVGYINYLPLWNFLIFLLLPPKTILGPITGGALFNKNNKINYLIRKMIFPIFYKISEFILNFRFQKKKVFSTELLKQNLSKKTIQKSEFNFVFKNFKFRKKRHRKNIDLLIYYRKHNNKQTFFNYKFIKDLTKFNFKIFIVGDKLNISGINNLGYISKKKVLILQSKSKYSLCSGENIYSLFVLECISNHVKILIDEEKIKQIKFFKKYFINLDKSKFKFKK